MQGGMQQEGPQTDLEALTAVEVCVKVIFL